jgi:hypothetical protein
VAYTLLRESKLTHTNWGMLMGLGSQKLALRGTFFVACLCTAQAVGAIATNLVAPSPLGREDAAYHEYVASVDARITREYNDRWRYHELQKNYNGPVGNTRHSDIGSLGFYNYAPLEMDVRRGFADQVLRVRVDAAMRAYFRPAERGRSIRKASQAFEKMKQSTMTFKSDAGVVTEFRYGYDVFTDFSKLECTRGSTSLGLYHTALLGGLTGSGPAGAIRPVFVQISTGVLGSSLPTPFVRYRLDAPVLEASLSKALSGSVSASVGTTQPLAATPLAVKTYGATISYSF